VQSDKDMGSKWIPPAVVDTEPVVKISKRGNRYTMWTESWFKSQVRGNLRQLFMQWPRRKEVLDAVRLEEWPPTQAGKPRKRPVVWYICSECGAKCKTAENKHNHPIIEVDHIDPVGKLDSTPGGLIEFINRLFCDPKNLRAVCRPCHRQKTRSDRASMKETWR